MADYRVRGYMTYAGVLGAVGGGACADSWVAACGFAGRWLLRSSPSSLKIEGPSSGFAVLKGKIISCPESIALISSDSSGPNVQADGAFAADSVSPTLVRPCLWLPLLLHIGLPSFAASRLSAATCTDFASAVLPPNRPHHALLRSRRSPPPPL